MTPLKGYWIYTTASTNMHLFGNYTLEGGTKTYGMSYPLSLAANTWYTIGVYDSYQRDDISTDTALSNLCTGACSGTDVAKSFDKLYNSSLASVYVPTSFDDDAIWDRGEGFWVHMTSTADYGGN